MSKLREFLDEFQSLGSRELQEDYLIEIAERFHGVPEDIARRPYPKLHQVPGCESEAYIWAKDAGNGTKKFHYAVENPQGISAKALSVILDENLSGEPLAEIRAADPNIVYEIFGRGLSLGKGQGLMGIVYMTKTLAEQS